MMILFVELLYLQIYCNIFPCVRLFKCKCVIFRFREIDESRFLEKLIISRLCCQIQKSYRAGTVQYIYIYI